MSPNDRGNWPLILALWGAGLGAAAQYGKISVIYDLLPAVWPGAGARLGWAVGLVGAVGIVLGVVAGMGVARIGYRRSLLWALWLGAALSAVQAAGLPFGWFLASRVIEGASHLAIVVAAPTLIAALATDRDRGLALTLWGTFFGVTFALIAWAGRPLALGPGPEALFAAHALCMGILALVLGQGLRTLPPTPGPPLRLGNLLAEHAALYASPRLAAAGIGWLFYTFCFVALLTLLPPFLPEGSRAAVQGLAPLAAIAVSMTLGVVALRRFSAVRVVVAGFLASALAALWLWAVPGSPVAAVAVIGVMGLVQGASFAAVAELNETPADRARANGAMAQMGNIGNTLGTPVIAAVTAGAGYGGMMAGVTAIFVAGAAAHLALAARRRAVIRR
ncbi:MFS transporter [Wenxinia saemankumensis]|uniref:Predicted arabinose efflux permease, MFS family n=1 Tax=Wenxinia saemankumensis TaxID=1447782 RepID=A0A1M6GR13_9RHOB|nr:MFS transporter [Wenxinia saemankumensis]SHJ12330.1 Predicted arabinose efflux permease, MFS family [Wenxinia saemankumensis]